MKEWDREGGGGESLEAKKGNGRREGGPVASVARVRSIVSKTESRLGEDDVLPPSRAEGKVLFRLRTRGAGLAGGGEGGVEPWWPGEAVLERRGRGPASGAPRGRWPRTRLRA